MYKLGPIKNLILLGSASIFTPLVDWGITRNVKTTIITSPDQRKGIDPSLQCMELERIDSDEANAFFESIDHSTMLAISFGARWLFTDTIIKKSFSGRLLNAHGTRLPLDQGGGGFSWRILKGDRIGNLLIHKIDSGIDTGPIVCQESYVIPKKCITPSEIQKDYLNRLEPFTIRFLESILKSAVPIELIPQNKELASYYPRLNSNENSWIDWQLSGYDIIQFINAFDDPYSGAMTEWRNGTCKIKNVQLHGGEVHHHPYQSGLIIRNNQKWLVVAVSCGKSIIVEDVRDEHGNNLIPCLKPGDRFFTHPQKNFESIAKRPIVTATGFKK